MLHHIVGGKPATAYSSRNLTELNQLVTAVADLPARGGGDCHEYGFAGILKAMHSKYTVTPFPSISFQFDALGGGSHVIVVTDAPSKDSDHCITSAIKEAKAKDITVHFFLSSSGCIHTHTPAPRYTQIAEETNGIVVKSSIDFLALTKFVQKLVEQQIRSELLSFTPLPPKEKTLALFSASERCHSFNVSAFDRELYILFKTLSINDEVNITKPDGSELVTPMSGATLKFFNDSSPLPGVWTVCVRAGRKLSISTIKLTDVKFMGAFLELESVEEDGTTVAYLASEVPYACECTCMSLVYNYVQQIIMYVSRRRLGRTDETLFKL